MSYGNNNHLDDQALIKKVLEGDTDTFKIIIKNSERLVAQIIYKMIYNKEERKDIAQEVYLKAFQKLNTFRFQSKLSTWIAQIAYNTCFNYLEKKKLIFVDKDIKDEEHDRLEKSSSKKVNFFRNEIEHFIFQKELATNLQIEIDKLPPLYKTLITLFHIEDLSYAEIIEITQLSEGTVKNYLFRARKALKENILLKYKKEEL